MTQMKTLGMLDDCARGGLRQGALRAPRALAPGDEPHRRRACCAAAPRAPRGRRRPPHQARAPHRRRPRRSSSRIVDGPPRGLEQFASTLSDEQRDRLHGRALRPPATARRTPHDRSHPPQRRQPPLVDARRDVLRAVHGDARQHGRERRAAVDPARPARAISGLEWTVNAYTLAFAVLLVTGGRLGDIFGRRRMFLFGVVDVRRCPAPSSASRRARPGWSSAARSRASAPRS